METILRLQKIIKKRINITGKECCLKSESDEAGDKKHLVKKRERNTWEQKERIREERIKEERIKEEINRKVKEKRRKKKRKRKF